ncbi:chromate transporter [Sulfurifustis variabilis]|uniref:Chromate transporter n=1 Tax=Sulfurifustis variabilis TaxID=1675686 RepID=A0A1B4V2L2_9GAMM|nr:chromate efflux transporter [Sulfurifustis variabilis]BAU47773.1 chromate transporter [Sulfurifustis variabilis]
MASVPVERLDTPAHPSLGEALRYWFKLGWLAFGGPAGQIAMMHHELVERRRWISERRFLHALNYCMTLPGPEAQQLATYIGWLLHGARGGIVAGTLFVLPSVLVVIVFGWIYLRFGDLPAVAGALYGIKPAVTAIVLYAAYRIGAKTLKNAWLWAIAAAAFVAIFALGLPFPVIIVAAGVLGWLGGRYVPGRFELGGGHGAPSEAALIDDHHATPEHARFSRARLMRYVAIGLLAWAVPLGLLVLWQGWDGVYTKIAWFFTKAALVTFGGAYAVLPYVYQHGVEINGWLSAHQMIDGLALGETTPGPLIKIVTFVGLLGGWQQAGLGPDLLVLAGILGGLVATFYTYLPSFLFILIGGPLVESTRGELHFTAPLTGITAAVVGVIVNLAVFFAYHVFWPEGLDGRFEWFSAAIGVAAFIALWRYKVGIIPVIGACAAAGLAWVFALQPLMS